MLFPHLLLFPYQPACDSASSASKLYKTQGKLPQQDATLLFPLPRLPLPHPLPPSLHVTNQSVYLSTGCTTWECGLKQIQCPPLAHSRPSYSVKRKCSANSFLQYMARKKKPRAHGLLLKDTDDHLDFLTFLFFIITFFSRKLICTKTSRLPSSGLKATLVDHQVSFSTSDMFFRGEMA